VTRARTVAPAAPVAHDDIAFAERALFNINATHPADPPPPKGSLLWRAFGPWGEMDGGAL
jgi:hypothetical protein